MITTRRLEAEDIAELAWSGGPSHLRAVAEALDRRDRGEVEYLVVCEHGIPRAKGGVDFAHPSGVPTLWQLATDADHRRRGFATTLVAALEGEITSRGIRTARLGVESDNEPAKLLYEKLGYRTVGVQNDSWMVEGPDGDLVQYRTVLTVMERSLASPS